MKHQPRTVPRATPSALLAEKRNHVRVNCSVNDFVENIEQNEHQDQRFIADPK